MNKENYTDVSLRWFGLCSFNASQCATNIRTVIKDESARNFVCASVHVCVCKD